MLVQVSFVDEVEARMNAAQALLTELRQDGVRLWLEGDELRYQAPKGVMSRERLDALRAVKAELVDFLRQVTDACPVPLLTAGPRPARLPVSHMQERLWILDRIEDLGSAYHISGGISLKGRLDRSAFEQALTELVRRHESLRTRFVAADDFIEQLIDEPRCCELEWQDLSNLEAVNREDVAFRSARAFVQRRFDLAVGPMFRVMLLRLSQEEHIAVVVMHHIVSDGWSLSVLIRELSVLYSAFSRQMASPLPDLPAQYADYALWQRSWLQGDVLQRQIAYWRRQLANMPVALNLPLDRPRPAVQNFHGASSSFTLPKELAVQLLKLAIDEGATLFMVLLAAFQHLLARLSGQDDIVIGTPVAGRTDRHTEGLIGFFVNTLVLRTEVSADMSLRQLLARAKRTAVEAYAHQDLPFDKLVEELKPVRTMSRAHIFQVLLALHNYPEGNLSLPGLRIEHLDKGFIDPHASKRDLSLHIVENATGLSGTFVYASDLFEAATIERFAQQFSTLLIAAAADPDRSLSGIALQNANEQRQLLVEWNDTAATFPSDCIHKLFEAQSARTPQNVALAFEGKQLSYADLNRRANQLAHYLRNQGIGPDVLVGICVERSIEMVVGLLGILKAGGAYVPLDPNHPSERLATMLVDARLRVLLTLQHLQDRLRHSIKGSPDLSALQVLCLDTDIFDAFDDSNPEVPVQPANLAYVIYTSGSTGAAKGVAVCHASISNFSAILAREIYSQSEVNLSLNLTMNAPYVFDMSLKHLVLLGYGHSLHILSDDIRLNPGALLDYIKINNINGFECTPSQLRLLIDHLRTEIGAQFILPENVLLGGEAVGQAFWDQLKLFSGTKFFNMYGPTEATVDCSLCQLSEHASPTIGRPLANYQIHLLDSDLRPVPIGVAGELCIAGAGLARGYLNRPELTAEKFIPNPFSMTPGARMYRSGDLARFREDGNIDFLGRIDHQVKIRGFRIELGEIEARLAACDGVREALVVTRDDGAGNKRLVAYVTARQGTKPTAATLRAQLSPYLADYMIPGAFVVLDALPLTPNGKVDRKALPNPDRTAVVTRQYATPEGVVEKAIAAIWQELLRLEHAGRYDHFFELGGTSLLATQFVARLRDAMGVNTPLINIFQTPVLADLAEAVISSELSRFQSEAIDLAATDIEQLSDEEVDHLLAQERAGMAAQ